MSAEPDSSPLSQVIEHAFSVEGGKVKVGDILDRAAGKGYGLMVVILSLPVAVPATPPGVSTVFGLLLLGLIAQMVLRRPHAWLPKWIEEREIKEGPKHSKFMGLMVKTASFLEKLLKTRFTAMTRGPLYWFLVIPCLLLTTLVMLAPLPIINSLSSTAALLIGLAMLEDDGLVAIGGVLLSLLTAAVVVFFLVALVQHGPQGIDLAAETIKGLFRRP